MESEKNNTNRTGTLYLIATPIGNLSDMSQRAIDILSNVDLIAAEDTRVTRLLLSRFGIRKPMESYHEHNRKAKGQQLIDKLQQQINIGLVSDAGMPCISDPGEDLVRECIAHSIPILVIPGPNAGLTALSGSGLRTDRFVFEGFLPSEGKDRKKRLDDLVPERRTLILYEAPHRLERTLADLLGKELGKRRLTLARELTKKYEEWLFVTVEDAAMHVSQHAPRGEYVLVMEGLDEYEDRCPKDPAVLRQDALQEMERLLDEGMTVGQAARLLSESSSLKKNELYQLGLTLQAGRDSL